jgi:hypothetical protein
MEDIETLIQKINGCSTAIDLEKIVSDYLMARSEADNARGETYFETAQRLGVIRFYCVRIGNYMN